MSRMTLGAGDLGRFMLVLALAGCGGSSELGLFGSGAGGEGGHPFDASNDRGAGGSGGATSGGGSAGSGGAPAIDSGAAGSGGSQEVDAGADQNAVIDARVDVVPPRDAIVDRVQTVDATGPRDATLDAVIDACRPTGERCDGIDNDCNGRIDDQGACPAGCIGATRAGHAYVLCYTPMARRPWRTADNACRDLGMHLVRIDDAAENAFLRSMADGVNAPGPIWIGASDIMNEGRWVWTDGTPFWSGGPGGMPIANRYSNWANGQPDDGGGNVDCAAMRDADDRWQDANCAMRRAYFCEE
jgi:hypothetical protein